MHELSHLFVGLLLGAKPYWISLIPHKNNTGYTMGYVEFSRLNNINSFPTAMAPLLLLLPAYYLKTFFFQYFDWHFIPSQILYIIIMAIIVDNAIPSWQDFKVGFYFFIPATIWIVLIILSFLLIKILYIHFTYSY
ncbi:hypothetical protein [Campylobacter fetus]|uniref:hypothetical protein n=1 Tax=Campylobacter fetus TaxID=196 RepID=UPI00112FA308|nr:hypothetical protein [Campylobacter fetus]